MYKCIPTEFGVDVSVNSSKFFTYNSITHLVTDLGAGRIRVSRKIDGLHELYDAPINAFTNLQGVPVATTAQELSDYLGQKIGVVSAGEGVNVDGSTVSVVAGGPATLGGYKVGTGLMVDGDGRLSATASSEVTKVLANETEMLGLQAEELRPYRVIRLDTNRLYYLNANTSPAVLDNWFVGPSLETTVLSFKGRTGAVDPQIGDYNFDIIELTDKTTNATHKFVSDDGKLYIENLTTAVRKEIAYKEDVDVTSLETRLTSLEDLVTNQVNGLQKQVSDVNAKVNQVDNTVNNATNGLSVRVQNLEARPVPVDYSSQITALQAKDTQIENLALAVNDKVDSTAANTVVLDQRVSALESGSSGTYQTQINSLKLNKADLVSGKVPLSQLPDIPVGRKVKVANQAARLALPLYSDITIAYQLDTGDAWALDANSSPSNAANWDRLGNAQGVGVESFNGRTGNISSQLGDYITDQIQETLTKQFVTPEQKLDWSSKETTTGSQEKAEAAQTAAISSAKTYADSTFIPISQKNSASGVAPLDADSKVPLANLPVNVPNGIAPLGVAGKVPAANLLTNVAGGVPLLNASAKVPAQYIETGTASGVAPLGTASKVPMVHILSDVAGGLPVLDSAARLPVERLPDYIPIAPRSWYNVKGSRVVGSWYTNLRPGNNELTVYVRSASSASTTREIRASIRKAGTTTTFTFQSDAIESAGNRWLQLQLQVPQGWEYQITTSGGSTTANIETWYELY